MANASKNLYSPGMSPQALAANVLKDRFGEKMPSIPIDPFKLMREYGIVYQLMGFENLEGIYLVPEGEHDLPVVGINYKRKITRQRFTAAHELCHHLKDCRSEICPKGGNGRETERFAEQFEQFAAELPMPGKPIFNQEVFTQNAGCLPDILNMLLHHHFRYLE